MTQNPLARAASPSVGHSPIYEDDDSGMIMKANGYNGVQLGGHMGGETAAEPTMHLPDFEEGETTADAVMRFSHDVGGSTADMGFEDRPPPVAPRPPRDNAPVVADSNSHAPSGYEYGDTASTGRMEDIIYESMET